MFTVRTVVDGSAVVLYVSHDQEDGAWQFLDASGARREDARLVALHEMLSLDPSLRDLATLPLGWYAVRVNSSSAWTWRDRAGSGPD